jgi:hypothetical protein
VKVDLEALEETATRAPIDLHLHLRTDDALYLMDMTYVLPLLVGLAAVALGRKVVPGVAFLGKAPFCVPGAPVAPVAGTVLSARGAEACVDRCMHRVIGGRRAHGDGDGEAGEASPKQYVGVNSLLEAIELSTR